MCFSVSASFVAGAALTAVGVLTLKKAKKKSDFPLASIPLLFGIQQITEGFVWLSFDNGFLNAPLTYFFVLFAYAFWPIYIPFTVLSLENSAWHKKALRVVLVIGIISALLMLYAIVSGPVTSLIVKNSVCYSVPGISLPIGILYLFTLCLTYFFSSKKFVKILGAFGAFSLLIAYFFYSESYASVWCFFAAIISLNIFWYFYPRNKWLKRT